MLEDRISSSYVVIFSVSPDKTIQSFDYRLFIVSVSVLHILP